jgi:hypothetical protein
MPSTQIIRLQSTFIWRTKDGSVKANDTNAAVEVMMISRDLITGTETCSDVTSACDVQQNIVNATSGLHYIEVIHTVDTDTIIPVEYIIVCRDNTADAHVFLSSKVTVDMLQHKREARVYPVIIQ